MGCKSLRGATINVIHSMIREADLSYEDVAAATNKSIRSVSRRFSGEQEFGFEEIGLIADLAGVPFTEVVARIETAVNGEAA